MLLIEQLKTFFLNNDIELQTERDMSLDDIGNLLKEADNISESFTQFIFNSIININRDGIRTDFSSWEELYECYIRFLIGFNNAGIN